MEHSDKTEPEHARFECAFEGYKCCFDWEMKHLLEERVSGDQKAQAECPCGCHKAFSDKLRATEDKSREMSEAEEQARKNARMDLLARQYR